jgi:anti-sigma B factor antagonist
VVKEVALVELIGDIDAKTAQAVQEKILPLAQQGSKILMGMTEVRYQGKRI